MEKKKSSSLADRQRKFSVTPEEIIWRMEDTWLDEIEDGYDIMIERVIPHLESEAIRIFSKAWTHVTDSPDQFKEPEKWRVFWVCEAQYAQRFSSTPGKFNSAQIAAVNAIVTASKLRSAMDAKSTALVSALSMMLICEAMAGGYSIEYEATKADADKAKKAKNDAYIKGAGKSHEDLKLAKAAALVMAKRAWEESPEARIGKVAQAIRDRFVDSKDRFSDDFEFPKVLTIKSWLKAAAKDKKLIIPVNAQAQGRPKAVI